MTIPFPSSFLFTETCIAVPFAAAGDDTQTLFITIFSLTLFPNIRHIDNRAASRSKYTLHIPLITNPFSNGEVHSMRFTFNRSLSPSKYVIWRFCFSYT
jgi:hypothetical protein